MSSSTKSGPNKKSKWFKLLWVIPLAVALLLVVVLAAKWFRELSGVRSFMTKYPGASRLPESAPVGFAAWLGWQHFFNSFFILLIISSGWRVRTTERPKAHWTRNNNGGIIRTKNPPTKISLDLWFHLLLDVLWMLNGIAFYVLLFVTGQWMRLVPRHWDVFPNALSTMVQYASLNWPTENGWVNYNSLQMLTYFTMVFIAAPLAIITGLRTSGAWPKNATRVNKIYPVELARAIHFPVMLYFVLFIIVHVTLVFATGMLPNLSHMYAASNDANWVGFWIFAGSIMVMVIGWIAARPLFLQPIASRTGKVTR
jgi:thiosulfate reductase cytochrome b subunit